jgi:hypothetical protein
MNIQDNSSPLNHLPAEEMDERRRENRKYLNYFSRVIDRESGTVLGYLVDMTTGGALLIGNFPLEPNTPLHIRIDLPEKLFQQAQLDLDVIAVWCHPDGDPEMYRTGLRLLTNEPKDLLILTRLLSSYSSAP